MYEAQWQVVEAVPQLGDVIPGNRAATGGRLTVELVSADGKTTLLRPTRGGIRVQPNTLGGLRLRGAPHVRFLGSSGNTLDPKGINQAPRSATLALEALQHFTAAASGRGEQMVQDVVLHTRGGDGGSRQPTGGCALLFVRNSFCEHFFLCAILFVRTSCCAHFFVCALLFVRNSAERNHMTMSQIKY